jgi:hypothetical protein
MWIDLVGILTETKIMYGSTHETIESIQSLLHMPKASFKEVSLSCMELTTIHGGLKVKGPMALMLCHACVLISRLTMDKLMVTIVIMCRKPSTLWPSSFYGLVYMWIQQRLKQWYTLVMLHPRVCHLVDMLIDMISLFQLGKIKYYKRRHAPSVINLWIINLSHSICMRFINSLLYRFLRYTVQILNDNI